MELGYYSDTTEGREENNQHNDEKKGLMEAARGPLRHPRVQTRQQWD